MLYQRVQRTLSLTAGDAQYTVGSGGDLDATRPIRIESAYTRDSGNIDRRIEIINNADWSKISYKGQTNSYPTRLFYRPNFALGEINLDPAPSASLTLYLEVWDQISSFATLDTSASLPPAYEYALTWNLALMWGPNFEVDPKPIIVEQAKKSKAVLKDANNTQVPTLETPWTYRNDWNRLDSILG